MQKHKLGFCMILVLALGLCSNLYASGKPTISPEDTLFQQKLNWIKHSFLFQKEGKTLLTSDFLTSHQVQKVNRGLPGTGAIRGRVTQASGGAPIEGVTIYAARLDCPFYYGSAYSESDGYYVVDSLPAGRYEVYTSNESVFVDVYWNNKPLWETPNKVVVISDDTTDNINFSLRVGGKITGMVTLPGATSVSVSVSATDTTSKYPYSGYADNPSGSSAPYEIKRLSTGTYKVNTDNSQGYLGEYYNHKEDWAGADPVAVTEGSTTSNIDFTAALGGRITGTVTLPGAPYVGVMIYAMNTTSGDFYSGFAYNPSGNAVSYEIIGLPTGTYKLNTYNFQGYLDEYYNDKPDSASADPVFVTAGSTTSNINFTLSLSGAIKGNISIANKTPLEDILMYGFYASDPFTWWSSGVSDASGNYKLTGLRSGWWKIFAYGDTLYAFEWYNDKSTWNTADSVLVTVPDTVSNINFTLEVGGSISGHVYGEGGAPLSGCDVIACRNFFSTGYFFLESDTTSDDGSYKIGGLRTGDYIVGAYTECGWQWWNHKPTWEQADIVHVTMPGEVPGIDFDLSSTFLCGDANGDGIIDVGDAIYILNYLFRNGPAPAPLEAGDANSDGIVDVGDAIYILNYLFRGSAPPCEK